MLRNRIIDLNNDSDLVHVVVENSIIHILVLSSGMEAVCLDINPVIHVNGCDREDSVKNCYHAVQMQVEENRKIKVGGNDYS
jgi:hypothetical protein